MTLSVTEIKTIHNLISELDTVSCKNSEILHGSLLKWSRNVSIINLKGYLKKVRKILYKLLI